MSENRLKLVAETVNVKRVASSEVPTWNLRVRGKVQGVGYRRFLQKEAQRLQLRGWVRNLVDGSVQASVQGDETTVQALIAKAKEGPLFSHVESIDVKTAPAAALDGFDVRPDGGNHEY